MEQIQILFALSVISFSSSFTFTSMQNIATHNACQNLDIHTTTYSPVKDSNNHIIKKSLFDDCQKYPFLSSRLYASTREFYNNKNENNFDVTTYFASCAPGLSQTLANEIHRVTKIPMDDIEIQGPSGVRFFVRKTEQNEGDKDVGLKALYWLRTAHRLLQLICTSEESKDGYQISDRNDLYDFIYDNIDMKTHIGNGRGGMLSIACSSLSSSSSQYALPEDLRHSHFTALTMKNAIVDACRDSHPEGLRPDVNLNDPDIPLYIALKKTNYGKTVDVSIYKSLHSIAGDDTDGERNNNKFSSSLHRRGYRKDMTIHKAALKESVAAGLLYETGFHLLCASALSGEGKAVLIDPMMGSGTLLMESLLIAFDIAPGLVRDKFFSGESNSLPPALRWKDSNKTEWDNIKKDAKERALNGRKQVMMLHECDDSGIFFYGNEMDPSAFLLAQQCLKKLGLNKLPFIHLNNQDCGEWECENTNKLMIVPSRTIVVSNPPWGKRLTNLHHQNKNNNDNNIQDLESNNDYLEQSWLSLKRFLRETCGGAEAWVLSGDKSLTQVLKMKNSRKIPLRVGGLDLRWIQYHIFQGSGKPPHQRQQEGELQQKQYK